VKDPRNRQRIDETRDIGISTPSNTNIGDERYVTYKQFLESMLKADDAEVERAMRSLPAAHRSQTGGMRDQMQHTTMARSRQMADYMRTLGHSLHFMDTAASVNPIFGFWMGLPQRARDVMADPNKRYTIHQLSGGMYSHNKDGTLNRVLSDDIREMFNSPNPDDWPQLMLTCNHAMCGTHTDVSGIMRGCRKLAMDTFGRSKVELIRNPHEEVANPSAKSEWGKKTLIVSAIDAQPNAWLNGAELLDRLLELRDERDKNEAEAEKYKQMDDYAEAERISGRALESDVHMSGAAKRLAKIILKLIVEDPDLIDVDAKVLAVQDIVQSIDKFPHVRHSLEKQGGCIKLRDNAADIVQHIHLAGYSKGGNTVSDAMRYLAKELRATKNLQKGGQPAFAVTDHHAKARDRMDIHAAVRPIQKEDIAAILRNIGVLCVAAGEIPLTREEKEYGIRRINVLNKEDVIATHFSEGEKWRYGTHDELMEVDGTKRGLGHSPEEALGYYEDDDGRKVGKRGYLHDNPHVHDRLECLFASMFNKLAVSDVTIIPAHDKYHPEVEVELAPGSGYHTALVDRLLGALRKALPDDVSIHSDVKTRSLRVKDWNDAPHEALEAKVVGALGTALKKIDPPGGRDESRSTQRQLIVSMDAHQEIEDYKKRGAPENSAESRKDYIEDTLVSHAHDLGRLRQLPHLSTQIH